MEWFRWYHGACSDAKWPIIARKAGVSVGVVVSVWAALLEYASQDEERGSVSGFDGETYDALYGYADGTCGSVVAALTAKGIIRDGCIRAWSRRQPVREREDATNAERQRRYRERRRREREDAAERPDDAARTPDDAAVTPDNAVVTPPEQNRGEQRRTEEDIPLSPESDIFPDARACEADGGEGRDGTARGDAVSGGADSAPDAARLDTARPDVAYPDDEVRQGVSRQDADPEPRPGCRSVSRSGSRSDASRLDTARPDVTRPDVAYPDDEVRQGVNRPDATRQAPRSVSRPGPARTDAPSKGTPEWTAFLSCWDVYPVKQGQEEAWREWERLRRNRTLETAWVIREAILTMCAEDSRWQRGKVPKFARWLNGKGWNDMPYVEPGDRRDAGHDAGHGAGHDAGHGAASGTASGAVLSRAPRRAEPAAPTEYQRRLRDSRHLAAALLAGRRPQPPTPSGGVYETTAVATTGGALPALRP